MAGERVPECGAHFLPSPAWVWEPAPVFPATGQVAPCSWRTFGDPRGLSQALGHSHFLADHRSLVQKTDTLDTPEDPRGSRQAGGSLRLC